MLINWAAWRHLSGFVKPLVKMSPACLSVFSYSKVIWSEANCSWSQSTETRWVRPRWRIVGFRPVSHTLIIAWLSSWTNRVTGLAARVSHRSMLGRRIVRRAVSAATISASGVECETHPCRLLRHVLGPRKHRYAPEVDLDVFAQPAISIGEEVRRQIAHRITYSAGR